MKHLGGFCCGQPLQRKEAPLAQFECSLLSVGMVTTGPKAQGGTDGFPEDGGEGFSSTQTLAASPHASTLVVAPLVQSLYPLLFPIIGFLSATIIVQNIAFMNFCPLK